MLWIQILILSSIECLVSIAHLGQDIPGTGNAPIVIGLDDLQKVFPIWADLMVKIQADPKAVKELGWVRTRDAHKALHTCQ
mgnify:CR=1 FL=1